MVRRLTHEEFMEKFYKQNPKANDIEILGKYIDSRTNILCRCKIDGHIWETKPSNLLRYNCPKCARRNVANQQRKPHEEFIEEIKIKHPNIEVLGKYINKKTKIKCRCIICGHEWEVTPNGLLNNQGCPQCVIKKRANDQRKTHDFFINQMTSINPNIEFLSKYQGDKIKIKCRCKVDGYEWETTPTNLLQGSGCPHCSSSKGEKKISQYLEKNNILYKPQYRFEDCKFYYTLPFDFYLPQYNCCIEFDGQQHYEIIDYFGGFDRFIETKIRDTIKDIYCKENNIKLIRIPYWDFDTIEEILYQIKEEVII